MHPSISRENTVIAGLCTVILVLFTVLWLLPTVREHRRLGEELPVARQRIADLRQTVTLLAELNDKLTALPTIGAEEPQPVPVDQTTAVLERLTRTAEEMGLTRRTMNMEVVAGDADTNERLAVTMEFFGPANAGRLLVHRLATTPQIAAIDHIRFTSATGGVSILLHFFIDLASSP